MSRLLITSVAVLLFTPASYGQWVEWPVSEGGNGHWYRPTIEKKFWTAAEEEAVFAGGHLVTIDNGAENELYEPAEKTSPGGHGTGHPCRHDAA